MKTLRDPVHGDMEFNSFELELIDTPQVQRMRGSRQLGTSYLVYPGAQHSRFEHSLGTCFLAHRILSCLRRDDANILKGYESLLSASALLHDLTHVPFGQTFEDERRIFPRHDESAYRFDHFFSTNNPLGQLIERERLGESLRDILLLRDDSVTEHCLIRQIISGTICADLLDYLKRDAWACGFSQSYDERIFKCFSVEQDQLVIQLSKDGMVRHDTLSELIHLLRIRYFLTERVYYHHAKIASGAMISKALELMLAEGVIEESHLLSMGDEALLYEFRRLSKNHPRAKGVVGAILSRQLYRSVYLLAPANAFQEGIDKDTEEDLVQRFHLNLKGERETMEQELAAMIGVNEEDIILYCPASSMALKEANVPVFTHERISLADLKLPEIEVLKEQHRSLWTFRVLLSRHRQDKANALHKICSEVFGSEGLVLYPSV